MVDIPIQSDIRPQVHRPTPELAFAIATRENEKLGDIPWEEALISI